MTQRSLGDFEQLLLFAILRLRDDAYGVTIRKEIEERAGRFVSAGAIYTALDRLESKGLVRSRLGDPEARRGGRARRYFEVSAAGRKTLRESQRTLSSLWEGVVLDKK